ncbi:MAG: sigma-70 family RNA polymerase sigma factor [bacterium]|nr:sigma-70 family RNA polymerase sigma factor [bacterium]
MNDIYLTRVTLLNKVKDKKDDSAWKEFYDFYWELITNWAKFFGCSDSMAKDIFQETIIGLIKNMPDFNYDVGKGRFRSFLKTIVRRRVIDAFRREGKYVSLSDDAISDDKKNSGVLNLDMLKSSSSNKNAEDDIIWLESLIKSSIRICAMKVDPITYQSFRMYVLEEQSVEEVAKKLDIPRIGTVYQHKSRFLSSLKKDFIEKLIETGELRKDKLDSVSEKFFSQALSSLISGRNDLRGTIMSQSINEKTQKQLNFIAEKISETTCPFDNCDTSILVIDEANSEKWYKIESKLTVGRASDCDITLEYSDVSLNHASITPCDDNYQLKDENSTNGIFVNSEKLEKNTYLKNGDIIQIGKKSTLIFFKD